MCLICHNRLTTSCIVSRFAPQALVASVGGGCTVLANLFFAHLWLRQVRTCSFYACAFSWSLKNENIAFVYERCIWYDSYSVWYYSQYPCNLTRRRVVVGCAGTTICCTRISRICCGYGCTISVYFWRAKGHLVEESKRQCEVVQAYPISLRDGGRYFWVIFRTFGQVRIRTFALDLQRRQSIRIYHNVSFRRRYVMILVLELLKVNPPRQAWSSHYCCKPIC